MGCFMLKMNNMKIFTQLLLCLSAFSFQLSDSAMAAEVPDIEIKMPSPIEDGIIVPVNIVVSGVSESDTIQAISLDVKSNPPGHTRVFRISYLKPLQEYSVGARARMVASQNPIVEVTVLTQSGKTFSKQLALSPFKNGIDFTNEASLTATIPGAFRFPSGEIGQPKIRIVPSTKRTGNELKSLIHHPMLPQSASSKGNYINNVDFFIDNKPIAHIDVGDATSNDPYFGIWIPSNQGKSKVVWSDTVGRKFEAVSE